MLWLLYFPQKEPMVSIGLKAGVSIDTRARRETPTFNSSK
jgi:hypothetical protein